jgi:glycosyltransferase involved in cell wall biosynthesis
VCTDRTGGADLAAFAADPTAVRVVPADDPAALAEGLRQSLADARADVGLRDRLGAGRSRLSWAAYAERYEANLLAGV